MTKTIFFVAAITVAFAIGIIASPSAVSAHLDMCAQPSSNSLNSVWHGLCDLQNQINAINVNDADSDPTNELQTLSGLGEVTLSDGGGTVGCADITGDASLCDGNDAVNDADDDPTNELQSHTVVTVSSSRSAPSEDFTTVVATCPSSYIVVGGGFSHDYNTPNVLISQPSGNNAWLVTVWNEVDHNIAIRAFARCVLFN